MLAACSSGPPAPLWQANAKYSLDAFQQAYLRGETGIAEAEFVRARAELASTGSPALVARAELVRCATRAASLEFDNCPGFEKLRADAGPEELSYAEYLAGRADRTTGEEVLSRLVSFGVKLKSEKITPPEITAAIDLSSSQGWRRPLLAWLGVQENARKPPATARRRERIRRRIALVAGQG